MTEGLRIVVTLPQDRRLTGTLALWAGDALAFSCPCLGKADAEAAMQHGNPKRDPTRSNGDTPLGAWAAARFVEHDPPPGHPPSHMGSPVAWLGPPFGAAPVDGQALEAAKNGRQGLAIHGGRGDARLVPTNGCLRLLDVDRDGLVEAIAGETFSVKIEATP